MTDWFCTLGKLTGAVILAGCWQMFSEDDRGDPNAGDGDTQGSDSDTLGSGDSCLYNPLAEHCVDGLYAVSVSVGNDRTCILNGAGAVKCWGNNDLGQSEAPEGTFSHLSLYDDWGCAINREGTPTCWGRGSNDLSIETIGLTYPFPGEGSSYEQIAIGDYHWCGLQKDGQVICRHWDDALTTVPKGEFIQVVAGMFFNCAITVDQDVLCWGTDSVGQTHPPEGQFTQISAGGVSVCGVTVDGAILCWGDNQHGQLDFPDGRYLSVSVHKRNACAIRDDGTVICVGDSSNGRTDAPPGVFTQLSTGQNHTCGLEEDGKVTCWGDKKFGASHPPHGRFKQASYHCGLTLDGEVRCLGETVPLDVPLKQIAASPDLHCGLTVDGEGICWNVPKDWRLSSDSYAVPPEGIFWAVAVGRDHACALDENGAMLCWGGECDRSRRVTTGPEVFTQISTGWDATCCGLTVEGTVTCREFCESDNIDLALPTGTYKQLTVGSGAICGLRHDGHVECRMPDTGESWEPLSGEFARLSTGTALGPLCGIRNDGRLSCYCNENDENYRDNGCLLNTIADRFTDFSGGETSCGVTTSGILKCWGAIKR